RRLVAEAPLDVYVAGAVEPAHAEALVRQALAIPREAAAPLRGTTPHPPPRPPREVRETIGGLNQTKLVIGLRAASRLGDPGFWPLVVMNGVLGGFPHSKLFRNVREKAGLCYDASSSLERFKGLVFIYAGVDAHELERARDTCLAQVEAITRGEIGDEELGNTRLAFQQAFRGLLDGPQRLMNLDYVLGL